MRERDIEAYLVREVEKRGGTCEKFSSPSRRHVPDRIVSDRPDHIVYVEVKAPNGRLTPGQKRDHARRRARGFKVFVVYSTADVSDFMSYFYGL